MLNFGFKRKHNSVPRSGLLLYLGRPNLEAADVPLGDDTEIGDDTIIRWMFLLPADAGIRSATGWVTGIGNIFYDAAGDPVAVLASEIVAWSSINQWNVLFHLVSAETETGRLAIYAQDTSLVILNKALKVLREDQIDVSPSAFFNGMDTTGKTSYTGGPTYAPDHLGVLRSPGANLPAIEGMRLDGTTYLSTDISGAPIVPSVEQKTRTGNADFSAFTPSTTFPRFDTSDPLKAPGWLCEPARTNKVTCRKSNPIDTTNLTKGGDAASVLSVVDDTAALTAAGLIGVCSLGKVYKLDNSAGTTEARILSGASVAGANSISAYVKGETGKIGASGSAAHLTAFAASGIYIRVKSENKTLVDGNQFDLRVDAGAVVYFILPQLEEGAFCTSPICKAADGSDPLTSLTRAGTVLTYPTAGKIRSNNMAMRKLIIPKATGQSGVYAYGTYLDANNYTALLISPTSLTLRKRVAGVDTDATVSITHTSGVPLDIIGIRSATFGMKIAVRSYSAGVWSAWTDGAAVTTVAAKANAIIGTTYQLGALNSVAQFTGNINLFDTLFIPDGIADPLAWAKSQWGIA